MIEDFNKLAEAWEKEAEELCHFKNIHMEFNNYWGADKARIEECKLREKIAQLRVVILSHEKIEVKRKLAELNSK